MKEEKEKAQRGRSHCFPLFLKKKERRPWGVWSVWGVGVYVCVR